MSAQIPLGAVPSLDSTYGVWLVSLLLETILYGIGVNQTWTYFARKPEDTRLIQCSVVTVFALETIQVVFFFSSTYFRFVRQFGAVQTDLIWEDSLQLLAAYLGAFVVQLFFASRIYKLTRGLRTSVADIGMCLIYVLAITSIVAGIAQTVWTYVLRSFLKIDETKAVTTVQAATSLACDVLITLFLYVFLTSQKGDIKKAWLLTDSRLYHRTNWMMDRLIQEAINRGTLTALASGVNLVLFLALPDTFWFFLGLAPSSKLYLNSMVSTLNNRARLREEMLSIDKGVGGAWNTIPMGGITSNGNSDGANPRDTTSATQAHLRSMRSPAPVEFKSATATHHGNDTKSELHPFDYSDSDVELAMAHKSIDSDNPVPVPPPGVHVHVERKVIVR
ncbi:hypothetical protein HMN09_01288700 [Mycena chlorophos]|uniref:DUF6534 domain-containing protein n=1 Tax=Mycena chlorophos TaxID=658473 RepID=A0A8H6S1U4_MYCCL|nr:hypothetical protein HMN09_01288700 [Mycena chlorophos]